MPLTEQKIKTSQPLEKGYRLTDEKGLFLFAAPSGNKVFRVRFRQNGIDTAKTIGNYPQISLAQARSIHDSLLANSCSPMTLQAVCPDAESGHTLKTSSSRRRVPLHPRLLKEFEFEAYYQSRRGCEYLFDTLNGGNVVSGSISHAFSKWFGRFLSSTVGIDDKKLRFHSFRHSFKAFARSNSIEKSIVDCMQGHASGEVSLNYGKDRFGSSYSLKTMLEALMRMRELDELV